MKEGLLILCAILLPVCGCAFKRYEDPQTGASAQVQERFSFACDNLVASLDISALTGRNIFFPPAQDKSSEYLCAALREKLLGKGVAVKFIRAEADTLLFANFTTAGALMTERDFSYENIPLYYGVATESVLEAVILGYNLKEKKFFDVAKGKTLSRIVDTFLIRAYGPVLEK